ncbi:MAG: undecaprenyldiphospho-muramoylpentapeptide beta-N-acetylglucosaminyltransferase [Syntrophorhabdaceae bacterium]|nr:undecaprenyldiphospho-muramoylpentapeptide beta-N-acetylglucosaminyltransferase [Syntrophorhabdaceae bacterium]
MKILISAGGTGGHIFPGIAVAEAFSSMKGSYEVFFVGTRQGMESTIIPSYGFRLLFVEARQFLGRSVLYRLATLLYLLKGIYTCKRLIGKEKPDAILGMGGFTSVPVVFAGVISGIPVFLHEQNVEPGLANKVLSRYAKMVFVSFPESARFLKGKNIHHTGNPLRKGIRRGREEKRGDGLSIFIFGGSRGAKRLNSVAVEMLPLLEEKGGISVYHQTGKEDFEWVKNEYRQTKINYDVFPFTENMADYYKKSDVVISRAGASTIFELAYFKKAAILIPYPYSAGQHQWKNASYVEKKGGGYVIGNDEATGERVFRAIRHLIENPELIKEMGQNMGNLYVDGAEEKIATYIIDYVGEGGRV